MARSHIAEIVDKPASVHQYEIAGWIRSKRVHKTVVFLDIVDASGEIQVAISQDDSPALYQSCKGLDTESSVRIVGRLRELGRGMELSATNVELIGPTELTISPTPRSDFEIFSPHHSREVLSRRHLYLRNAKLAAVMKIRHRLLAGLRLWLNGRGFIEISPPILTKTRLYKAETAFPLDFFGEEINLSQCSAFYLECAIPAFERVYSIAPSFRAEKSGGRRHLAEFWHLKCEIAFADLDDIMHFVEDLMNEVIGQLLAENASELEQFHSLPDMTTSKDQAFPRLTFDSAQRSLGRASGHDDWERSLSSSDLKALARGYSGPFWVTRMPATLEHFSYRRDPTNADTTLTADLIGDRGFGELIGVAEKVWDAQELMDQLKTDSSQVRLQDFEWYYELRKYGSVPHSGLGMGIERVLRWLLSLNHVRDAIPFPRLFGRHPAP